MNLKEARKLIEVYLATNWTSTAIKWENVESRDMRFPARQILEFGQDDYLAADIDIIGSRTITVPAHCIRYSGLLITSICVKEGKGASLSDGYTDTLIGLLENKTLQGTSDTLRIRNITGSATYYSDTGWFVSETQFSFYFNRFVSSP